MLLKYKDGKFRSHFYNSFSVSANNKFYLFFSKTYSVVRNSIGYVSMDKGVINEEGFLRVALENEYLLPLAKKINEHSLIIPFKQNKELGLLRVTL